MKKILLLLTATPVLFFSCRKDQEDAGLKNHPDSADTGVQQSTLSPEHDRDYLATRISSDQRFTELSVIVFSSLERWEQLIPFSGDTSAYIREFARQSTRSPVREDIAAIQSLSASIRESFPALKNYSKDDQKYIIRLSFQRLRPMSHASCKYAYDNNRDDCRVEAGTETIINIGAMTVFGGTGVLAGVWVQGGILVKRYQCMQRASREYTACVLRERRNLSPNPIEGKDYKLINCRYISNYKVCDTFWVPRSPLPFEPFNP